MRGESGLAAGIGEDRGELPEHPLDAPVPQTRRPHQSQQHAAPPDQRAQREDRIRRDVRASQQEGPLGRSVQPRHPRRGPEVQDRVARPRRIAHGAADPEAGGRGGPHLLWDVFARIRESSIRMHEAATSQCAIPSAVGADRSFFFDRSTITPPHTVPSRSTVRVTLTAMLRGRRVAFEETRPCPCHRSSRAVRPFPACRRRSPERSWESPGSRCQGP